MVGGCRGLKRRLGRVRSIGEYKQLKVLKDWRKIKILQLNGMVVNKIREVLQMQTYELFFYYTIKNKDLFAYSTELIRSLVWS